MIDWFLALTPAVQAAIVAAVVGLISSNVALVVKHTLEAKNLRHRLEAETEYEQRRNLKAAIGKHLGRILERAERLDQRLWNLQRNQSKGWLAVQGQYKDPPYYFKSTIYRVTTFFAAVRAFFDEAIYIDPRYASGDDLTFLRQLKALEWAMTDVALFAGLNYDDVNEHDHVFRGTLHAAGELLLREGDVIGASRFDELVASDPSKESPLRSIMEFFDGLNSTEDRYRWDRLVVLHLLLMSVMASFGYDMQRPSLEQFRQIARTIRNPSIARELADWLPKLGLTRHPSGLIVKKALAAEIRGVSGVGLYKTLEVEKFLKRG